MRTRDIAITLGHRQPVHLTVQHHCAIAPYYYASAVGGALCDTAIRPSLCPSPRRAAALCYRNAGCLQLSHMRTADQSADGRRSAASRTAIGRGISRRLRDDNLYNIFIFIHHQQQNATQLNKVNMTMKNKKGKNSPSGTYFSYITQVLSIS